MYCEYSRNTRAWALTLDQRLRSHDFSEMSTTIRLLI